MCHVLIIEDESLVAMQIEELLGEGGATSFAFAATADEAIASAMARLPAVITSDVVLEAGTGPQAVAAIHARLGPIPVLFVTGTPEACAPCDGRTVVTKPFTRAAITQAFRDIIPV